MHEPAARPSVRRPGPVPPPAPDRPPSRPSARQPAPDRRPAPAPQASAPQASAHPATPAARRRKAVGSTRVRATGTPRARTGRTRAATRTALTRATRARHTAVTLLCRAGSYRGGALVLLAAAAGLAAGAVAVPAGTDPPAPRAVPLGFAGARAAHTFHAYAARLGLADSTVALGTPGSVAPAARQRVVGLAGGTGLRPDAARHTGDMAALRRHLLERVRPEFLRIDEATAEETGLTPKRLAAHGYRPLVRRGGGGDFVHRSALTAPERLPALRAWARAHVRFTARPQ